MREMGNGEENRWIKGGKLSHLEEEAMFPVIIKSN